MIVILVRTTIVFAALLISMRLMGKRQLGELELSELVVAVLISNLASHPLQDIGIPIMNGLLPIIVLLCWELLLSELALKSPRARGLMYGKPSILIADGKINQDEMRRNRFTIDELYEELRKQIATDISKIKYAILETDGTFNVLPFAGERPVTAAQLGIVPEETGKPVVIISDGRVMSQNFAVCGKDELWLEKELCRRGVSDTREVYLLSVDEVGKIYFAEKQKGGKK